MPQFSVPESLNLHLWSLTQEYPGGRLCALLDGARDERIYPTVVRSGVDYRSLYRADVPEVLAESAPYLVELEDGTPFTQWLLHTGWGQSWGIYLIATETLDELRDHFRQFLSAEDEDGKPFFFRFYDPRVLRLYLPACTADELVLFFGPVRLFGVENEKSQYLTLHSYQGARLVRVSLDLTEPFST